METVKDRPILFSGPMIRAILSEFEVTQKSQTRRVYKDPGGPSLPEFTGYEGEEPDLDQWITGWSDGEDGDPVTIHQINDAPGRCCPYGKIGGRLWVRETFQVTHDGKQFGLHYLADKTTARYWPNYDRGKVSDIDAFAVRHANGKTLSSIHMPRWASRLTLEITGIRIERLQDITEKDAAAEGVRTWLEEAQGRAYDNRMNAWCRYTRITDPKSGVATMRGGFAALWDSINEKRGHGWAANPWVWVIDFRRVEAA